MESADLEHSVMSWWGQAAGWARLSLSDVRADFDFCLGKHGWIGGRTGPTMLEFTTGLILARQHTIPPNVQPQVRSWMRTPPVGIWEYGMAWGGVYGDLLHAELVTVPDALGRVPTWHVTPRPPPEPGYGFVFWAEDGRVWSRVYHSYPYHHDELISRPLEGDETPDRFGFVGAYDYTPLRVPYAGPLRFKVKAFAGNYSCSGVMPWPPPWPGNYPLQTYWHYGHAWWAPDAVQFHYPDSVGWMHRALPDYEWWFYGWQRNDPNMFCCRHAPGGDVGDRFTMFYRLDLPVIPDPWGIAGGYDGSWTLPPLPWWWPPDRERLPQADMILSFGAYDMPQAELDFTDEFLQEAGRYLGRESAGGRDLIGMEDTKDALNSHVFRNWANGTFGEANAHL